MRGVIYARYSEGPGQTDKSIDGQVADCRAFAERNGISVVELPSWKPNTSIEVIPGYILLYIQL